MMDRATRRLVDAEWATRLGLSLGSLHSGAVHVVAVDIGANDAMSFLLGDTCVIAVRPEDLDLARSTVGALEPAEAFTADVLLQIVGAGATVDGPSRHAYADRSCFRGLADSAVEPTDGDDPALLAFLEKCGIDDWAESGFPREPGSSDPATTRFWVVREHRMVVAAGNMTEWRGLPADVGLLTDPAARSRGLAKRVAATMVAEMLPTIGIARYRALATNRPSLAVAAALGFTSYGANFRARRHAPS